MRPGLISTSHRLPIILAVLVCGCDKLARSGGGPATSNPELQRIFDQDQAARSGPLESVDIEALARENSAHRTRVGELAAAAALRTAKDFYHAAMVFQHGPDSLAYAQAHQWARRSEALDSTDVPARWLVAAAWDRYQMSRGRPQWFGTQTTRHGGVGPVILYLLDTTRVTDAERVHRGVGTLAALRARLDTINRRLGFPSN
jgi:hypothetical protein